ncbi:acyltransferase family protein [Actinomycetospora lemnae]|uniref:Acyltransferase family protein n=1 Tax=Actinomycetospora lemnae TaxID=3019891 RepID=A0ABT5SWB0_9PSEU|nr:acyltransferase family protein [Actinomycetospora sp. DW7H6]MDD7966755.1 acyltransferase family protein [Actinomycetospora sp. DW7H6]
MDSGTTTAAPGTRTRSVRRPEIEGLRGLAALLVVVYHVWVGRVSGGVDVFFLLSGFFVLGMTARTAIRGERVDVTGTWTRLFWRLVPTAGLVLVTSAVAAAVLLPPSTWSRNLRELLASVFFVENWRLATDAVDYYADHGTASIAQHFWSLSIQAQFTLLAPLLVLAVAWWARSRALDVRSALLTAFAATFVVSFVHSVVATASDQAFAYFDLRTRLWEFALGGVLALVLDGVRIGARARAVLGWAGVIGLVSCGAVLDVGAGFPGYLALWPVLSAAAVIVAGRAGAGERLLRTPAAQYLGRISYPLYLWHWPVLVLALGLSASPTPGAVGGLVVVAVSVGLAVATHHLVEPPLRTVSLPRAAGRAGLAIASFLVPALVALGVWAAVAAGDSGTPVAVGDPAHPGATALATGDVVAEPAVTDPTDPIDPEPAGEVVPAVQPSTARVQDDWAQYRDGCGPVGESPALEECVPVRVDGEPQRRIVLLGDSHMQQLLPALEPVARERGWEVRTLVRARCPFGTTSETDPGDAMCLDRNAAAIEHLAADPPDAVLVSATRDVRAGLTEQTPDGFVAGWQELDDRGIPVVAVRDNPRFDHRPSECFEAYGRGAAQCDIPRAELLAPDPPYALRDDVPAGVSFLDLSDEICTPTACPPEIGNVLVYLDDNHLSASYARTMSPAVGARLPGLLGW